MSDIEADRGASAQLGLPGVLPPGTLLRGYEVKSVLGKGAFGITYRAIDTNLHRDVAIKEYLPTNLALREGRTTVLPHSPAHAEQFAWGRDRFLEEARTLARLERTPGIVRVYDFLEANGTAYMVMALIDGETLLARLNREKRLTHEAVERLLVPLLDGLEEFHAATYLHRDIKPANIMVDDKGKPTLIDFGASRAAMAERSTTMTAVFTPGYAAAEQFVPTSKLGPSTDIYGLSATLYHAITGHIPPSAFERILKDNYEPLSDVRPEDFPESLLAGIDAGMAVPAADRPQSIAEWRAMLYPEGLAGQQATRVARKPGPLARAAARSGRARIRITLRGGALWGAIAGLVLLLAGGSYLVFLASSAGSSAAYNLTAEQLEQALGERRKADALAAEKRRLVEEAQRRADTEAEAKRRAETELQEARLARQKAEEDLAKLKADVEAREAQRQANAGKSNQADLATQRATEEAAKRKAEEEATALRQAEEEATKRAAADAEAKRLADEALAKAEAEKRHAEEEARKVAEVEAAKQKADEEARQKAETAAKAKGDAEALQKVAEANERALRLEPVDRQRVQVALTSLGFDTRGSDGVFGPRSREMISGWQKSRNEPTTGFLSASHQQALLKQASAAVTKFDDEQKKLEEEKTAAAEARARAIALAAPPATEGTSPTSADGLWRGAFECSGWGGIRLQPEIKVTNGSGSWAPPAGYAGMVTRIRISIDGPNVSGYLSMLQSMAGSGSQLSGSIDRDSIRATSAAGAGSCTLSLTRDTPSTPAAPGQSATTSAFDGTYTGVMPVGAGTGQARPVRVVVTGGRGSGTISSATGDTAFTISIAANGRITGAIPERGPGGRLELQGEASANGLSLSLGGTSAGSYGTRTWLTRGDTATAAAAAASAFDGTYVLSTIAGSNIVTFTLKATKGIGLVAISRAGCSDSQFDVTISPAGEIVGQGDLKCFVSLPSPQTAYFSGPLSIRGSIAYGDATLRLHSTRADYSYVLRRSAN